MSKIIISHRGNLFGPNSSKENHPDTILNALKHEFHVEIDLWHENNKLYLGHDSPEYEIGEKFLNNKNYWIHAKNIDAAYFLTSSDLNWFFHDQDDCVLTSKGYLWTFPGKKLTPKSIAVMPERISGDYLLNNTFGICTDYAFKYKSMSL